MQAAGLATRECETCHQTLPLDEQHFPGYDAGGRMRYRRLCHDCWRASRRELVAGEAGLTYGQAGRERKTQLAIVPDPPVEPPEPVLAVPVVHGPATPEPPEPMANVVAAEASPTEADYALIRQIFARLPVSGTWTHRERERWVAALVAVVDLLVTVDPAAAGSRTSGDEVPV